LVDFYTSLFFELFITIFTSLFILKMKFRITLIAVITVFSVSICLAGPPPPPSGAAAAGSGFACWPPPCIPIDGGISLLIAAGAIYGSRKLYSNQKEKNSL
jgi:hypothetical protein